MTKFSAKHIPPNGSELESDFQKGGVNASWASGFPKTWGSEKKKIGDNQGSRVASASLSHDESFLAVAVDKVCLIFETGNFEVVETLSHTSTIMEVQFSPVTADNTDFYHLLSSDDGSQGSDGNKPRIVLWTLNERGSLPLIDDLDCQAPEQTIEMQELSSQASTAAISKLLPLQEWTQYNSISQKITSTIDCILKEAADCQRMEEQWHTEGSIANFGSRAISADGKMLCYISTYYDQTGPQHALIVVDISTKKELWRRQDHADSIMWAEFSPDTSLVASSAWDQFLNVYNSKNGQLVRSIGPSGGQNWNAAFSPTSKLIACSRGSGGPTIFLWDIQDSQQFPSQLGGFRGWSRTMSWSSDGQFLAAGSQSCDIKVWNPHTSEISQHWRVKPGQGYQEVSDIMWLKGGERIVYKPGDSGLEIYDFKTNKKWRWGAGPKDVFARGFWSGTVIVMEKKGWIGSIDQDGSLRFWDMPV